MENSFTRKTNWLWQNAEKILIIIFLLTFSFNIRKFFLTPYSFLNGTFNEYLTINLSWADGLMIAIIIIFTIKSVYTQVSNRLFPKYTLNNTKNHLSIFSFFSSISRETILLILFLIWAGLSIFWSKYKPIAFNRFITLLEIGAFIFIAIRSVTHQKWLRLALFAVIINGLFQSVLGIAQFIHNRSLGFRFLGESIVGPNINGVAKIILNGEKHIRAYGTFSHPNILAGFLLIPIFIILSEFLKRFVLAKKHNAEVSRGTLLESIPSWLTIFSLLILILGLLLAISRSSYFGILVGMFILGFIYRNDIPRKFYLVGLGCFILVILGTSYLSHLKNSSISIFSAQSLRERSLYQNVARETISSHPIMGVGIGQFVFNEQLKHPDLDGWQYQPVHNIYLLLFSELGIVGLFLFLLSLAAVLRWKDIERTAPKLNLTYYTYYCIVFSFLFIFLFDHYFWDIKFGMIIFLLPILFLRTANYGEA
jgi:O-antigen ligase